MRVLLGRGDEEGPGLGACTVRTCIHVRDVKLAESPTSTTNVTLSRTDVHRHTHVHVHFAHAHSHAPTNKHTEYSDAFNVLACALFF